MKAINNAFGTSTQTAAMHQMLPYGQGRGSLQPVATPMQSALNTQCNKASSLKNRLNVMA
jgi:hypothetical protein